MCNRWADPAAGWESARKFRDGSAREEILGSPRVSSGVASFKHATTAGAQEI